MNRGRDKATSPVSLTSLRLPRPLAKSTALFPSKTEISISLGQVLLLFLHQNRNAAQYAESHTAIGENTEDCLEQCVRQLQAELQKNQSINLLKFY